MKRTRPVISTKDLSHSVCASLRFARGDVEEMEKIESNIHAKLHTTSETILAVRSP
jgi:hypothetical protein